MRPTIRPSKHSRTFSISISPGESAFILRTNDGFRYDFDLQEETSSINQGYSGSQVTSTSAWSWTQSGQDERTYVFAYDGLDRLTGTAQYKNSAAENKKGEDLSYDRNGNITSLGCRNGSTSTVTTTFTYTGNKRNGWTYDSNGNVTCTDPDAEYPITVTYNILNLPALFEEEDGYQTAVCYLADGTKYTAIEDSSSDGYIYCGPFRCSADDGEFLDVAVAGGRAVKTTGGWVIRYFTADHLGSTRLVTDASGSVIEQFDYLPYGEKCINSGLAVANSNKTEYLYGGKELPQLFGIDWYDSAARWQTTSGVFTSPDPLMEKYHSISPYAYCAGNPVTIVDPEGLSWYFDIDTGEYYEHVDDEDDRIYLITEAQYEDAYQTGDLSGSLQALRGDNLFGYLFDAKDAQRFLNINKANADELIIKVISFFYEYANTTEEGGNELLFVSGATFSLESLSNGADFATKASDYKKIIINHDEAQFFGYDIMTYLAHEIQHQKDVKSGYYKKNKKDNMDLIELRADNFAENHWAYKKAKNAPKRIQKHKKDHIK